MDFKIDLNVNGLEGLAQAILSLAGSTKTNACSCVKTPEVVEKVEPAKAETPIVEKQEVVPTTTHEYTLDELSRAAIGLMDKGLQANLMETLQAFGVSSLPEIPKEKYGEFALKIRELGADI